MLKISQPPLAQLSAPTASAQRQLPVAKVYEGEVLPSQGGEVWRAAARTGAHDVGPAQRMLDAYRANSAPVTPIARRVAAGIDVFV